MIEKMRAKLKRMETELDQLISDDWDTKKDHGGTPHILDNSKGRAQHQRSQKQADRIFAKMAAIKEQKEKIERMESKIAYRNTVTKKSQKFTDKNPIHPMLFKLAEAGKITQWKRNPHIFFIAGLDKVALCTFDNKVGVTARFPTKNQEDRDIAKSLIDECMSFN